MARRRKNKAAAKSLLLLLAQPWLFEKLVMASGGYDLPSFANMATLKNPGRGGPKGTLFH